ncbi:MAG: HD domain-containing protein [Candidatus Hydrogenedentes bacterium]|nr:HD domain-containing protein [Candidatus Hydrogenedentota bacterium]
MRVVKVDSLQPGFVVGKALLDDSGQTLLHVGVVLSPKYIEALKEKGYTHLYIDEADAEVKVAPEEELSPIVRARAMNAMREVFESLEKELTTVRTSTVDEIKSVCASDAIKDLMGENGPLKSVLACVDSILNEVLTRSTLAGLTSLKSDSSGLYAHAIDVCVIAIMIGQYIGLSSTRMRQLATGCLLHDVGKVFLDKATGERDSIRLHTVLGYELLKNNDDSDILAPHVALQHHEHQDGTGQPRGLMGSNTIERNRNLPPPVPTLIGEIAAVANCYDNLLSGKYDPEPLTPDRALGRIRFWAGTRLNREIVSAFLRVVPVFPVGLDVFVEGGVFDKCLAIVTEVNPQALDKPRVAIYRDSSGRLIEPFEFDLSAVEDVTLRCKPPV